MLRLCSASILAALSPIPSFRTQQADVFSSRFAPAHSSPSRILLRDEPVGLRREESLCRTPLPCAWRLPRPGRGKGGDFLFPAFCLLLSLPRLPQPLPEIFLPTLRQFFHSQRPPHRADLRLSIPFHNI